MGRPGGSIFVLQRVLKNCFNRHEPEDEVLIGEEVLNLSPDSNYNIHFPYRRGDINLHEGIGKFFVKLTHQPTAE